MSRKPSQQPADAYDYRRAILLVQVMAMENNTDRWEAIHELCLDYGIHCSVSTTTIHKLAVLALEHARNGAHNADLK